MPRICTSASDPIDYCQQCFPDEAEAEEEFGDVGDGPDGRGNCFEYDTDHPPYEGEGYTCNECGIELLREDDYRTPVHLKGRHESQDNHSRQS